MIANQIRGLRFGAFELDLANHELRKGGTLIKLAPQPFQVLRLLAEGGGEVRTREEIRQALWGDGTHVDFDRNLNVAMVQIRAALCDDADAPRFIQTIPRRGYRFVAPVEKIGEPVPVPLEKRPRRWPAASAIGGLVLAVLAIWHWIPRGPAEARPLIAALPFEDLSGDARSGLFLDGLTEELISRLGSFEPRRLGVIARTSVMRFRGSRSGADQIGRELGARYLVEGSVRWEGDRVHVTARLVQVSDQAQIASDAAEFDAADPFAAQQWAAARIAAAFGSYLFPGSPAPAPLVAHSREASEAYREGRALERAKTIDGLNRAAPLFRKAVELDPAFAEAWSALAETYVSLGKTGAPAAVSFEPANPAAATALRLNDRMPEAHNALANVLFWHEWNWQEAGRHFDRAVELNPSLAVAQHDRAFYQVAMGHPAEALQSLRLALALDPLSPRVNIDAGWLLLQAHRYDEAIEHARRSLVLDPNLREAHSCIMRAAMAKHDFPLAAEELGRATGRPLPAGDPQKQLAAFYRERVVSLNSPYLAATWYAFLGDRKAALDALERAFADRSSSMTFLRSEPALEPLHGDPRFQDLVRRMNLP